MTQPQPIFDVKKAYGEPNVIGVLLSGGIDSTTALASAVANHPESRVVALMIDYGQRHRKEIAMANAIAGLYHCSSRVIDLSKVIPDTTLTNHNKDIPDVDYSDLEGVSPTYVPFRNGLMISAATSVLVGILEDIGKDVPDPVAHLYTGMHAEDAAGFAYPDCTPEFAGSMQNAIMMGTYGKVRLITPFIYSKKHEIITTGDNLAVPYEMTWSCYKGGNNHCGMCPTCRARRTAFRDARVADPTIYDYPIDLNDI